jgi:hypothetical protein
MQLYIKQIPTEERIILAGDHTAWPRLYADTLKDRTYEHGAKVISGKPVTLGQGYSTLAWIPEAKGSWALPLRHERITSFDSPLWQGAFQLRQACNELEVRPLSLWDSEYGCARFIWNRFAKQRLHWTKPQLSTPEQAQRWSDLMALLTWQLWLAPPLVTDCPLPWQKSLPVESLTPGRGAQSLAPILAVIGSPAPEPKPRGKSPGWTEGKKRRPKIRYPVVKKRYSLPPRQPKSA